jgi:glycosyltransferase involved in cell wall biosynthesis
MKKIAFLGPNLESYGGVNVVINHLSRFFRNNGFEVHLFPVGRTKIKESEFIHPINSNKKSQQFEELKAKLSKFNFDLIIANNLRTSAILSSLNTKNDLYIIHQGRILQKSGFLNTLKQKLKFKKIYENKRVVFLNNCFKDEFLKKFKISLNYKIIPNPFDFEEIKKRACEFDVKGEYILGVGRFTKDKNFDYLIKSYAKGNFLKELWLLGDGEERENLKKLVEKLNLKGKVKFLGWQENPYPYIKNASLLVHPSKFEALPTILIEALILNTPVIATDIKCGPGDILMNELKDFLAPLNRVEILSNKMKKALKSYPKIKDEYIEKYRLENVGCQYLQFLQ